MPQTTKAKKRSVATRRRKIIEDANQDLAILPVEEEFEDRFRALFDNENQDDVLVMLTRTSPDYVTDRSGERVGISGYCENLPPGLSSYEAYIKETYGGGTFQAHKKVNHRFAGGIQIKISGRPKLLEAILPSSSGQKPGPGESAQPEIFHDVDISGTDADFDRKYVRMVQIERLFRKLDADSGALTTKDVIELLVKRPETNAADQLSSVVGLIGAVKDLMPDAGGAGAGWPDIINNALGALGKLAQAPGLRPGKPPPAGQVIADSPESFNQELLEEGKGQPIMNNQTIAGAAIVNIISGFNLDPRQEPERMVRTLDAVLGLDSGLRAAIANHKEVMLDLAEVQLSEQFADAPERRKEFEVYFGKVFDLFVDPQRKSFSFS